LQWSDIYNHVLTYRHNYVFMEILGYWMKSIKDYEGPWLKGEKMKNLDEKLKLKQLTLRMPENLHREFKVTAVKEGRTMGDVTIELIRQYLEKISDPL
jgi:predicted HicB family RNase H-like nuclease